MASVKDLDARVKEPDYENYLYRRPNTTKITTTKTTTTINFIKFISTKIS